MDAAEVLDDLGRVPVGAADAVGAGVAHHLAAEQVRLGGLARAAGAGRGDDGDVGLDQAGGDRRDDRERGDGRVAAGDGDPPRAAEQLALAGQLGEAVGPGAGVLAAVERRPLPRVGQPEVGAAVDDDGVLAERLGDRGGLAVRQAEEDDVVAGQGLDRRVGQDPVGQREQVRLERAEPLARVGAGGQRADLDVGVPQQQAQHLAPGVPTGSGDGD